MGYNLFRLLLAALPLLLFGCGGRPIITRVLPENVMAQPVGTVGIISLNDSSAIITAMRALGIPFHRIPVDSIERVERYGFRQLLMDEDLLEDEGVMKGYRGFLDHIRKGSTLILLRQKPEVMRRLAEPAVTVVPREVEYSITLLLPRGDHPLVTTPNHLLRRDLDSLSPFTHQLSHGDRSARAVIAANLQSPDSSAALLVQPAGRGAIWYVAFPIAQRAAAGYEAEQKLLANLVSFSGK
jgi:hypothetical protein